MAAAGRALVQVAHYFSAAVVVVAAAASAAVALSNQSRPKSPATTTASASDKQLCDAEYKLSLSNERSITVGK